ncbi:hypothetical protein AB852_16155 [Streptomyces uncialis]|uniref:Uncharacterized protein n=2 Tax=Streptomyces uncialis TaxID=1048205 RepID=A0A1Q4V8T7_9ACTN|nr:hypothetical protein AB852_16155 [Streptomyces uncialis]
MVAQVRRAYDPCMKNPPPASRPQPLTLRSGRSDRISLEDGAVSLTRGAVRRRIPLTAVEEARTPDGRTLEIVLTAAPGRAATTYRFTSRYAATLAALRDAVNAGRPPRDVHTPRVDGESLVEVVAREAAVRLRDDMPRVRRLIGVALYLAGLALMLVAGDGDAVLYWAFGAVTLAGVVGSVKIVKGLWLRIVLRGRGVTVTAEHELSDDRKNLYRFTDTQGVEHRVPIGFDTQSHQHPEQIQVTYDPNRPGRATSVLPSSVVLAQVSGLVLLGVPALVFTAYVFLYLPVEVLFL